MKKVTMVKLGLTAVGAVVSNLTGHLELFLIGIALIAGALFIHAVEEGMAMFERKDQDGH